MPPDFDEENASSNLAASSVGDSVSSPQAAAAARPGMNRSASEYAFREFLRSYESKPAAADPSESMENAEQREGTLPHLFSISEESGAAESEDAGPVKNQDAGPVENQGAAQGLNPLFGGLDDGPLHDKVVDPQQYEKYLKNRLELACAAVALARAGKYKNESASSMNRDGEPLGIPALPPKPELSERALFGTSGSSHSEDDEADTDLSASDPSVVKRMRRMLSNRESARRSRRRKQAHMSDLEMQVAHLRVENSSLLKKLDEVNRNYNEAAVDNRVLKSDVEALSAKVKMAEDLVSRAAANGSLFPQRPQQATLPKQKPQQQGAGNKMNRTPSMQRVASLEHLQKRIRGAQSLQPSTTTPVPAAAPRSRETVVPPVAEYDAPAPTSPSA